MSNAIGWIAAEAERPGPGTNAELPGGRRGNDLPGDEIDWRSLPAHQFPAKANNEEETAGDQPAATEDACDRDRERRIYRGRTVAMLRRYMRYSIETGRLPSLLGREFFRAKVTSYTVESFEDRVIFVHDMEVCLDRLDEFSRQLIARHILQEHDQAATGRLLHCTERTVRSYIPMVLDLLSDILLEVGLMEPAEPNRRNSCQGGKNEHFAVTGWEDGKNKS